MCWACTLRSAQRGQLVFEDGDRSEGDTVPTETLSEGLKPPAGAFERENESPSPDVRAIATVPSDRAE